MKSRNLVFGIFFSFFFIFLINNAAGMGNSPKTPIITIHDQHAKLSMSMIGVAAVFMKIENSGEGDDNLISARISIKDTITELHDVKDGKMIGIEKIRIPAKSTVELKPKHLHIMLFKLPKDMKEGDEFTMHLSFERSGEKSVNVKF